MENSFIFLSNPLLHVNNFPMLKILEEAHHQYIEPVDMQDIEYAKKNAFKFECEEPLATVDIFFLQARLTYYIWEDQNTSIRP